MKLDYVLNRLGESSTWRGLIGLATALGVALNPEQVAAITSAGIGLISLINVFRKERK
jgi:hypothetical protein